MNELSGLHVWGARLLHISFMQSIQVCATCTAHIRGLKQDTVMYMKRVRCCYCVDFSVKVWTEIWFFQPDLGMLPFFPSSSGNITSRWKKISFRFPSLVLHDFFPDSLGKLHWHGKESQLFNATDALMKMKNKTLHLKFLKPVFLPFDEKKIDSVDSKWLYFVLQFNNTNAIFIFCFCAISNAGSYFCRHTI